MSKEAMKLALEALEPLVRRAAPWGELDWLNGCKAITALREALAQDVSLIDEGKTALDKMAENARELGLDYEPVCNKDPQGCWNVRCQLGKKCKNTPAQREPVVVFRKVRVGEYVLRFWPSDNGWMCGITSGMMQALAEQPAQRTWVGLTDEERKLVRNSVGYNQFVTAGEYAEHVQKATEFKLLEKNNG
jgi:hypothetical protein